MLLLLLLLLLLFLFFIVAIVVFAVVVLAFFLFVFAVVVAVVFVCCCCGCICCCSCYVFILVYLLLLPLLLLLLLPAVGSCLGESAALAVLPRGAGLTGGQVGLGAQRVEGTRRARVLVRGAGTLLTVVANGTGLIQVVGGVCQTVIP